MYIGTRRKENLIDFPILEELIEPLERIRGNTEERDDFLINEMVDRFCRLSKQEQDERYSGMSKKWPKKIWPFRLWDTDRINAIVGNTMLEYWIEIEKSNA